jgi:hypothetical protein
MFATHFGTLTTLTPGVCRPHRMSLIPGDEYISSCLWPFLSRYSIAAKSFLSRPMPFSNSVLHSENISFTSQCCQDNLSEIMTSTHLANDSKCGLAIYFHQRQLSRPSLVEHTASFFLLSRRHVRYSDSTCRCRPEYLIANGLHWWSSQLTWIKFFLELEDWWTSMMGAFRRCRDQSSCRVGGGVR